MTMLRHHSLIQTLFIALMGAAIALLPGLFLPKISGTSVQASSPPASGAAAVCEIVTTMPDADDTDNLLMLLGTNRSEVINNLNALKRNMGQYEAEGYGWQNVIDSPGALDPQMGSWLIGALSMSCEASSPAIATVVTGTVTYRERIGLPPNAILVVRLEDVSLADAPSVVIAERRIETAGQQVPIPFVLAYDRAEINPAHRYTIRAQIFYDDQLRWTSTTAYPVITQESPVEVEIELQQV